MLLTLATTSMPHTYELIRVLYNEASQHKKQNNEQGNPTTHYSFININIIVIMMVKIMIFENYTPLALVRASYELHIVPRTLVRTY